MNYTEAFTVTGHRLTVDKGDVTLSVDVVFSQTVTGETSIHLATISYDSDGKARVRLTANAIRLEACQALVNELCSQKDIILREAKRYMIGVLSRDKGQ